IAFGRGAGHAGQPGRVAVGDLLTDQPQDFHSHLHSWIGMLVALLSQNLQIFLRKRQRLSLGHSWTPSRQEVTSYREGVYRTLSKCPGKVSFRAVRSIMGRDVGDETADERTE